jgi:hypothetical protein
LILLATYSFDKGEILMSNSNQHDLSQRFWITSNIAWLSLCIIAAAWGNRLLPSEWQNIWAGFGVLGLAAALGLAVAAVKKRTGTAKQL